MNIDLLEQYLNTRLSIGSFVSADSSMNGLQVGLIDGHDIAHIGYAVDASLETFRKAAELSCDALLVHHGLFWGKSLTVTGNHYRRIATLLENNISLFAYHLPLDAHPEIGNNAVMARLLDLEEVSPFGEYHGVDIGYSGVNSKGLTLAEVTQRLNFSEATGLHILPFGQEVIHTIAVISGGAPFEVSQAVEIGADLYITGESSHTMYSFCKEEGINMISGGHYQSEVFGVRALAQELHEKFGVRISEIDVPTLL